MSDATERTPEEIARSVCEAIEAGMRKIGHVTTAHYDAGLGIIAYAIREARKGAEAERDDLAARLEVSKVEAWNLNAKLGEVMAGNMARLTEARCELEAVAGQRDVLADALREAAACIEDLVGQQAMTDDFYVPTRDRIAAALASLTEGEVTS